jgi:tetratricopeptide (TPR) repeat protein
MIKHALLYLAALAITLLSPAHAEDQVISPFSSSGSTSNSPKSFCEVKVDPEAAAAYGDDFLEKIETIEGPSHALISALTNFARTLTYRKYYDRAELILKRSAKLTESPYCNADIRVLALYNLARFYYDQERYIEAQKYAQECVDRAAKTRRQFFDDRPIEYTSNLQLLSRIQTRLGQHDEAVRNAREALQILKSSKPVDFREQVARAKRHLGWCYAEEGKIAEASQFYEQAICYLEKIHSPGQGLSNYYLDEYIEILENANQKAKAKRFSDAYYKRRNAFMNHPPKDSERLPDPKRTKKQSRPRKNIETPGSSTKKESA